MTKDLYLLSDIPGKTSVGTEEFILAVRNTLDSLL